MSSFYGVFKAIFLDILLHLDKTQTISFIIEKYFIVLKICIALTITDT